jgi:hypothetical protein
MNNSMDFWTQYFATHYNNDYIFTPYRFRFNTGLYRARPFKNNKLKGKYPLNRILKEQVTHIKHLCAPPREFTPDGRCNPAGCPILYLSNRVSSLPSETRLNVDDLVVFVKFNVIRPIEKIPIIGWDNLKSLHEDGIAKVVMNHFDNKSKKAINIDKRLSKIFSRDIVYQTKNDESDKEIKRYV